MRVLALLVCGGCQQIFGLHEPAVAGDARHADAIDAPPDGLDANLGSCFGQSLVRVCFAVVPTGMINGNSTTIDTDSSGMCASVTNTNAYCVVAASSITTNGTWQAHGSRPLVLFATGNISIMGTLDVASHRGGQTGPGADAAGCNAGTAPAMTGGGAGGSFGGLGGDGGGGGPGIAGVAGAPIAANQLRGGCPGQDGANSNGTAGAGGGAVWLLAGGTITVPGNIDASGAGGGGGLATDGGAGGGGSGGYVGLEAPMFNNNIRVYANGGGGGEGGETVAGNNGGESASTSPAPGGNNGTTHGGPGGQGSAGLTLAGNSGSAGTMSAGSGGGGGGAGIVHVVGAVVSNTMQISPPPS